MHHVLLRAIVTGFGLSIGAALYKKVAKQLGLEEPEAKPAPAVERTGDGDGDLGDAQLAT